jgi:predicted CXXCH cytochrome family protein
MPRSSRLASAIAFAALCSLAPAQAVVCSTCHPRVSETYRRTGMARSLYRPRPENKIEDYSNKNTFYHQPSDSYFTMIERDGRYFQRRYQIGFDGKPTNLVEMEADYIVGSGNHVRSYLYRTGKNTLVELPIAWYVEKGGYWAMNPGYDRPDHQGFRRTIGYDCMSCHNAYPDIPPGSDALDSDPVFTGALPEGIDCQRCHGPGQKHIQIATTPNARREEIRGSIVNPVRLTAERQMEVCMQCHLETTSFPLPNSIVRYEREPFSYRPGEPLANYILHFDQAPGKGHDDKFEIANSVYRLLKSACFQKSDGAMTCTTCHNPHDVPRGDAAARHYTEVCRQCHGKLAASATHPRSDDCVGCHMPKRRTDDVVHVSMTDHYIQRQKPARDLLAEIPEQSGGYRGNVVLYYPRSLPKPEDELYLAIAQVAQSSNLTEGITRLSAAIDKYRPERAEYYVQLGDAFRNDGKFEQSVPVYEEALRRKPRSVSTLRKLALSLASLRQPEKAAEVLKRALEVAPNDATTWQQLGLVYVEQRKNPDAIAALQKAIELDSDSPEAYNSLGGIWYGTGDAARAEPALRNAIRIEPNYAEAHNNLGSVLSSAGHFDEAKYHFEAALRYKPDYNFARFNYAIALGRAGRLDPAQQQIETLLRSDPNAADAHEFLGTLLMAKGQPAPAIEHYKEAIRIRPEFVRAQLNLGNALSESGDVTGAVPHLEKAAQSSDPAIREEALRILGKLGKQ